MMVWASMRKRFPLRLVRSGLHRFCQWRIAFWERQAADAQKQNDWVPLRTYLYRQEQWEGRARAVAPPDDGAVRTSYRRMNQLVSAE
jgi:hypothetical protein